MEWAAKYEYVVLTHDLDFSAMLALSHAAGPSVLQVRAGEILPDRLDREQVTSLSSSSTIGRQEVGSVGHRWLSTASRVRILQL